MNTNSDQDKLITVVLNTTSVIVQATDEDDESVRHEDAWRDRLDEAVEEYVAKRVPGLTVDLGPRRVHPSFVVEP